MHFLQKYNNCCKNSKNAANRKTAEHVKSSVQKSSQLEFLSTNPPYLQMKFFYGSKEAACLAADSTILLVPLCHLGIGKASTASAFRTANRESYFMDPGKITAPARIPFDKLGIIHSEFDLTPLQGNEKYLDFIKAIEETYHRMQRAGRFNPDRDGIVDYNNIVFDIMTDSDFSIVRGSHLQPTIDPTMQENHRLAKEQDRWYGDEIWQDTRSHQPNTHEVELQLRVEVSELNVEIVRLEANIQADEAQRVLDDVRRQLMLFQAEKAYNIKRRQDKATLNDMKAKRRRLLNESTVDHSPTTVQMRN